jgi:phosphopantothenoylcysteine synthetase/decarboxylase
VQGGGVSSEPQVVGVIGSSAGGVEHLRDQLVVPLIDRGFRVAVTLTPTAASWLEPLGELEHLASLTGLPVRSRPRLPSERSPHPRIDAYVVAPASANTVAKLALGISDNQALTLVNESMGAVPVVVFPRVNAAHARHPAWEGHLGALRRAGVRLIYGDDVWRLFEPREAPPGRPLPWGAVLDAVTDVLEESRRRVG